MFQRSQHQLNKVNSCIRAHKIAPETYAFALEAQRADKRPKGIGRKQAPTLPDIYHALIFEGLDIVESGQTSPVFIESEPAEYQIKQIRFSPSDNERLLAFREKMYAGQYKYGPFKTFPLQSLAVILMEVAIQQRKEKHG